MNFEFDKYKLRKPKVSDVQDFINITNDKEVMKYYGSRGSFIKTINEAKKEIDWGIKQFSKNAGKWIITEKNKDQYIGDIGFFDFIENHKRVELGYKLYKEYWGKGIITNFVKILVNWGFAELGYNRIQALVDSRNEGSKIVLIRNQFKLEGTLREYEFEHGLFVDLEMYSLLKKNYLI